MLTKDGHKCRLTVGNVVRLPDDRTAVVVLVQRRKDGDVVTVSLPANQYHGHQRFPSYMADALRWVS